MPDRLQVAASLYHESAVPFAYAHAGDLVVRLRIGARLADRVDVVHFDKFKQAATRAVAPAALFAKDGSAHEVYQARLVRESKRFCYYFAVHVANKTYWYSRQGLTDAEPTEIGDVFEVAYLGERDAYTPPAWAIGTTYYQIFPDRFFRTTGSAPEQRRLARWDSVPKKTSFFGGNLRGIREKLDYLADLGVETLYLTPIFKAPSNHKYDTVDYFAVDPHFGTEADLRGLVAECHIRGIRVILDAVFNHMGAKHPIFLDLLKHGEASKYADWIYPKSWPLSRTARNYETFSYVANMPKWRTATPEVQEYLCQVGEYWIKNADIDGWRLDVADEVEHAFWKHFRTRVKAQRPDALICGEVWQVATPWLCGDEFDAAMNYPFRNAVIDWLGKAAIDAQAFYFRIERLRTHYPEHVLPALWNLLDSHDTARLMTACMESSTQVFLASFLQFTFVGSPVLYYGDEVGMTGGEDPLCRAGMAWDEERQDLEIRRHYQTLFRLRKTFRALREGDFRPAFFGVSNQLYAFVRTLHDPATRSRLETAVCFVNNGEGGLAIHFTDPEVSTGFYRCVYGECAGESIDTGQVLRLPAKSASMWLQAPGSA